ncbi:phosphate transport system substrate-binding protein [Mucilaginibacter frigoritolerans]|uniref:Phosphate transport system substrate-binding protein n=1 Tax=Mucilaginibacter frigoritolerans TaxID=652788 RepID=A0A562U315_9SPHI|nr:substrate-binding domain-containing protein [Mucilaginibacter frigoritolerans]TWI99908.1 phosphate transport system substrate-binding protein [Mucilaginibacter frigoritolerans]
MKYNRNLKYFAVLSPLLLIAIFSGCKQKTDTTKAVLNPNANKMVVDESFQPIVDEELYIFKAANKDTLHPVISYSPENIAVNSFMDDSVRVAILARDLTANEYKALRDTRNAVPNINRFAIDAITIIVNEASNDTSITVSEIKKMLGGYTKKDKVIVFDNPNSGVVRYLKDFTGYKDFKQKNIYALKSNKEAIKYVAEHPNAIGIVGFSWLNDPDKDYSADVQKVKIVGVKDDVSKNNDNGYITPSQSSLALKQYPLTRNLYILYNTSKLGKDFEAFILGDRGQRIILKSGLLPDMIPVRDIVIEKKIKTSNK